jgi:hypothetical protein
MQREEAMGDSERRWTRRLFLNFDHFYYNRLAFPVEMPRVPGDRVKPFE